MLRNYGVFRGVREMCCSLSLRVLPECTGSLRQPPDDASLKVRETTWDELAEGGPHGQQLLG